MANNVALIERELDKDYMPALANILLQTPGIPALAFKSAFMESVSKNKQLEGCTKQSLFNCISSFAFAGLMPGSFTGQAWMLPFRDNRNNVVNAVPCIGYMGYNTMAARSGIGIEGMCIRKDDKYRIIMGSKPDIYHEPNLEKSDAQIIGCWTQLVKMGAEARYSQRALGIKQLMAIKNKSKGSRKEDSPWNDSAGPGFEAMCEKSGRRLQKRSIPLNAFILADGMETLHDLGKPAWIMPSERDGSPQIITPQGVEKPPVEEEPEIIMPPKNFKFQAALGPKIIREAKDVDEWKALMINMIKKTKPGDIPHAEKGNKDFIKAIADAGFTSEALDVIEAFKKRKG